MKIVIIADPHIGLKNSGFDRNPEIKDSFTQVIHYMIQNELTRMICLGDFWDSNRPDTSSLSSALEVLRDIQDRRIYLDIITGNHDEIHNITRSSALEPLTLLPFENLRIHQQFNFELLDDCNFIYAPYISRSKLEGKNIEEFITYAIEQLYDKSRKNYMFGHFHMEEFPSNQFIPHWKLPDLKQKFQTIFNGHIHDHVHCPPSLVPGSLVNNNFAETGTPHFIVYDFSNDTFERIPLKSRKFITFQYDTEKDGTNIKINTKGIEDNFVRIEVTMNGTDNVKFKNLEEVKEKSAKFFGIIPKIKKNEKKIEYIVGDNPYQVLEKVLVGFNLKKKDYEKYRDLCFDYMKDYFNEI